MFWTQKKKKKRPNCQQFSDKFPWDAFHSQVFYQNGLYWTKWKAQLVRELSNYYSSVIQRGRTHFVNHKLVPAHGRPPLMFITLGWRPTLFELPKPLLHWCTTHSLIPKSLLNHIVGFWAWVPKFVANFHADALLNFLGHQLDTHKRFRLIASNWAIWAGGNNTEDQGHMCPHSPPHAPSCLHKKKWSDTFRLSHVDEELCACFIHWHKALDNVN